MLNGNGYAGRELVILAPDVYIGIDRLTNASICSDIRL
jgi:hypothetical protein